MNPDHRQRIMYKSVLRIHDIFGQNRIRGSIPLTLMDPDPDSDPDADPPIFVSDRQHVYEKLSFSKFLSLITFEGTFTSFLKDKKS
jgi:hypothetical protein